ncbi:hypothetical protein [Enterococcus durans]|uniref:DUF3990 domain-containing protein n=2 Tax=Enterococcus durans TaxID=53345 RepID=A0AB36SAG0_9ENTE|nr:hypothetical protein [Enterococcus durans]EOT29772.1 hypothetical protein OMS_02480 [Enterococcus durans ATCC 6056]EOU22606.1 hypothetical protein I571_01176 [Enterococcus durans ATCC 6056]PEH45663.1 hypothetical protein CRM96_11910 [Enterococcus durans]
MIGYHGTSRDCATKIIESKNFNIDKFVITGDFKIKDCPKMPNDFGSGIYMFLSNERYNGIECARKYANVFKDRPSSVLEININDDIKCLDFEDKKNIDMFIKLREKIFDRVYYNYKISVKESGSKKRANLDGIIIEFLIQHKYKNEVDAVMGESYTPSYNEERNISNFPNGKEICLRQNEPICWELCKEVHYDLQ